MAMFDTLRASQRLREEGGFNERQAHAIAGVLADDMGPRLATRDDIRRLEERMERLEEQMAQLEESLKQFVHVRVGAMIATATALVLAAMAIATAILAST